MYVGCAMLAWDAISLNYAATMNAAGGANGTAIKPMEIHPYRQDQVIEHDITVLQKLLG